MRGLMASFEIDDGGVVQEPGGVEAVLDEVFAFVPKWISLPLSSKARVVEESSVRPPSSTTLVVKSCARNMRPLGDQWKESTA